MRSFVEQVLFRADVVPCGADAVLYRLINLLIIKNKCVFSP